MTPRLLAVAEALRIASDIIDANIGEDWCRHTRYVLECDGDEDGPCTDRSRRDLIRHALDYLDSHEEATG